MRPFCDVTGTSVGTLPHSLLIETMQASVLLINDRSSDQSLATNLAGFADTILV